jgi:hypothetical protein
LIIDLFFLLTTLFDPEAKQTNNEYLNRERKEQPL